MGRVSPRRGCQVDQFIVPVPGEVLAFSQWQVRGGTAHEAAGDGSPGCALDERRGAGVHDGVPRVPGLRVS